MKLGKRLQRERERRGITQRELGLKVGLTSGTYISQIESGEKVPPLETSIKLANALGLEDSLPFVLHAVRERSTVEYQYLLSRVKGASSAPAESPLRPLPVRPWTAVAEGGLPEGAGGSSADVRCIVLNGLDDVDSFALEVGDDTMAGLVNKGDIVVVSPGRDAINGDLALVRVAAKRRSAKAEIRLAQLFFRERWTDLVPGCPGKYPVETYPSSGVTVLGKVVVRISSS